MSAAQGNSSGMDAPLQLCSSHVLGLLWCETAEAGQGLPWSPVGVMHTAQLSCAGVQSNPRGRHLVSATAALSCHGWICAHTCKLPV